MQEFQRLHDQLHAWKPSALSELNVAFANRKAVTVSPELKEILQDVAQLSGQSNGLFNPAIGGLIKLWGFQSDEFKPVLPDDKQIAILLSAQPQMRDISFKHVTNNKLSEFMVSSSNRAVQLDLGGYAKG